MQASIQTWPVSSPQFIGNQKKTAELPYRKMSFEGLNAPFDIIFPTASFIKKNSSASG